MNHFDHLLKNKNIMKSKKNYNVPFTEIVCAVESVIIAASEDTDDVSLPFDLENTEEEGFGD